MINIPHRLVSLHRSIFMLMDTMGMKPNNTDGFRGFRGTFNFISSSMFDFPQSHMFYSLC